MLKILVRWSHLQNNLSYVITFCWLCHGQELWRHSLYLKILQFKKVWSSHFFWHRQNCNHIYWNNLLRLKHSAIGRTQRVHHEIYIFCGSSLSKIKLCQFCQVSLLWDMCDRFSERWPSCPVSSPKKFNLIRFKGLALLSSNAYSSYLIHC